MCRHIRVLASHTCVLILICHRRALGDIGNLFNNNLHVGPGQAGAKKVAGLAEKPQV